MSSRQPPAEAYINRPTICRTCGALVPAGEKVCAQCDARQDAPVGIQVAAEGDAVRFARAVLSRPYMFTVLFLVANLFIFLLMWSSSGFPGPLGTFPEAVLVAYGAKLNSLIKNNHEWWRLVTPVFIHVSIIHLMVNMYSLWQIGPYVEKLYGSAKFVVFWVVTGVAGVAASYMTVRPDVAVNSLGRFLFKSADVPSAGASGALFGLVGVLFVFGIKYRRELPEGFRRAFGTGLLPVILLNLFIGYVGRGFIDNAAHLGGLCSGAVLALVVDYKRPDGGSGVAMAWRTMQIAALALVAISFATVGTHLKAELRNAPNVNADTGEGGPDVTQIQAYLDAMNAGDEAVVRVLNGPGGRQAIDAAAGPMAAAPKLGGEADSVLDELRALVERAAKYADLSKRQRGDPRTRAELEKLATDFDAWQKRRDRWIETGGKQYGIFLKEKDVNGGSEGNK